MKRNPILNISAVLILTIAASCAAFSQTSVSTTAPRNETVVGKNETVSFLIEQNEAARLVIAASEKRINDLEAEVAATRENSASVSRSYESAKSEITALKFSNEALSRAVAINEDTINKLREDLDKQREKAKKATRDKWKAIVVAGGIIAVKLLL